MRRVQIRAGAALLATGLVAGCGVSGASGGGGEGGSYPDGTIEVVVTYDAGGASDQLARTVSTALEEELGATVVVQNEAGGAGTVGMTSVVRGKADGYQLGFIAGGPLTVQPHYGNTTYAHDDVTPVARVAEAPLLLAVRDDSPYESVQDLVADLKAKPGGFTYASSGAGNPGNIAMEKLDTAAGVETEQVPFESSGEVASALLGGNVDAAVGLPSSFSASVESGELRVLANLGDVRSGFYEEAPTLQESGFEDAITNVTNGVVAPPGLPDDVRATLEDAISTVLEDPAVDDQVAALGFVPQFAPGDDYGQVLDDEYSATGEVLRDLGLVDG